jgi:all-trans-8'-apo-beta-carotenal 15,15'-oxygenase
MVPSRRELLTAFGAAAALAAAPNAFANAPLTGVENAPAAGFPDAPMRLIRGRAPQGLEGALYRNGPGWFRYPGSASGHWFDGDGFVQRFALSGGRARHSARFVDTPKRRRESREQRIIMPGFGTRGAADAAVTSPDDLNAANTSVLMVGDELWALWEGGSPTRLDPQTLETRGVRTLREDLAAMPFLAHPKVEPSGRIWNLGVSRSRAIVWRLSASGALEDAQVIDIGARSYVHDWAVTERFLIIPLQPWLHERLVAPLVEGYVWRGDQPFRVLVLDKNDYANRRVYELPPMFFFHTGDAWEEADGTLRFDLCATPDADFVTRVAREAIDVGVENGPSAELVIAVLHPDGRVELQRSRRYGEFPQTDRRRQGLQRDLVALADDTTSALGLMNWRTGAHEAFSFGRDHMVQEHLFVPKPGRSGEPEAWLVGITLNRRARATELHAFDVARVSDGPVATWRSPYAAPLGFHGLWAYS